MLKNPHPTTLNFMPILLSPTRSGDPREDKLIFASGEDFARLASYPMNRKILEERGVKFTSKKIRKK